MEYLSNDRGQGKLLYIILIIERPPLNHLSLYNKANGQYGYLCTNSMAYKIKERHKKEELLRLHARTKKTIVCVLERRTYEKHLGKIF